MRNYATIVLATLLVACSAEADTTPRRAPETPITCDRDADCPHLSCGPCKSGEVIREKVRHTRCGSNNCPGAIAVCKAGTCRVR